MELVKKINKDVSIVRGDNDRLILTKFESIDSESIMQDRINLIKLLQESSFACPGLETVDGYHFKRVEKGFEFYQEYIDFECADQGNWYNTKKIKDSIRLLIEFQNIAQGQKNLELEKTFKKTMEDCIRVRRKKDELLLENEKAKRILNIIEWTHSYLDRIDELQKIPCHASFRHHNLMYDANGRLHIIDFCHGIWYAPRIYDLCVLMSIFQYGFEFSTVRGSIKRLMRYRSPKEALTAVIKFSTFNREIVRYVLDQFKLTNQEKELLVPCFFLMNIRNLHFCEIFESASFLNLISIFSDYLGIDSYPQK